MVKPMYRVFEAPFEEPIGDGLSLVVQSAAVDGTRGLLVADVALWNSDLAHSDRVVLDTDLSRRRFLKAAVDAVPTLDEGKVRAALLRLNAALFGQMQETKQSAEAVDPGQPSQATKIIGLAADAEFFQTPAGDLFATIPVHEHRETWPLRSQVARRWLGRRFYEGEGRAPSAQALHDAMTVLEGRALFEGTEHPIYTRVAEHDGHLYLDLGDAAWRAVEITSHGWRVVTDPPVKFRRGRAYGALPEPLRGGRVDELRRFLNVGSDADWHLLVAWLLDLFRPRGPHPVLALLGEQGTAKSTTGRALRLLVDPSTSALRAEPKEVRDLMIAATNGWIVAFDNLSRMQDWLSDALCRLATGGGFSTRELFTDAEEIVFDATRPVLLTAIEDVVTRGDLLDRALIVTLPPIPEDRRQPEDAFWRAFEEARPRILGALLDAVAAALRHLPTTKVVRLPRMADFALWVTAAEGALGWESGAFLRAYAGNRATANDAALEASLIVPFIVKLAESSWEGTATELLDALGKRADEETRRRTQWPKTARALSGALRRLAPNLRATDVEVTFSTPHGKRLINLARARSHSVPCVPAFCADENPSQATEDGTHGAAHRA